MSNARSAISPLTASKSAPANPRRSLCGRSKALTWCPRAVSSWTRLAPIKPEAPVTKHFMVLSFSPGCSSGCFAPPMNTTITSRRRFFRAAGPKNVATNLTWTANLRNNIPNCMPKKISPRRKLSRRQQRDLDLEISFMRGVVRRDPGFVEALQVLGDDYTRRGKFQDGLKIDRKLAQLRPEDPAMFYNLACSYSLTKRYDRAVAALSRAIEQGYRDFKWLVKDPDLHGLRQHPL